MSCKSDNNKKLMSEKPHRRSFYEIFIKRFMDVVISTIAIIVLSPVLCIIALLVKLNLGSPVLFTQERPGLDGKIFKMYKFRTMKEAYDENGEPLPDEERLTRFGKTLRALSLDELPELFNVYKGDMSIVGPRPLLVRYLPRYNVHQMRRHEVKPGITGLAQVKGRNAISWEEKFDWDVEYVDHVSLILDIGILIDTVRVVFKREGISSATSETMEEFYGSK